MVAIYSAIFLVLGGSLILAVDLLIARSRHFKMHKMVYTWLAWITAGTLWATTVFHLAATYTTGYTTNVPMMNN